MISDHPWVAVANNLSSPRPLSALRRPNLLLSSQCSGEIRSSWPLPFGGAATGLYGHMLSMLFPEPQHQWSLQTVLLSMSDCCYPLIKLHKNLLASFVNFVSTCGSTRFEIVSSVTFVARRYRTPVQKCLVEKSWQLEPSARCFPNSNAKQHPAVPKVWSRTH